MSQELQVYIVHTQCGRLMAWNAFDKDDLRRIMGYRGYKIKKIERVLGLNETL